MSNKKLFYRTPDVWFVELSASETLLAVSTGATLPGVEEEEIDYLF